MIKNYLITAWRNLIRHKAFTSINIIGLSVGLTCSLFILLWVQDERSIDAYHANKDRLYQVYVRTWMDHKWDANYATAAVMADQLKKDIPEIEDAAATLGDNQKHTFEADGRTVKMDGIYGSSSLFHLFSYPLIQGNAANALPSSLSIAISNSMATMFFGSPESAMGKNIRIDNKMDLQISSVFKDLDSRNSTRFSYVISWDRFLADNPGAKEWYNDGQLTFVMLRKDANLQQVQAKLKPFLNRFKRETDDYKEETCIQPIADVYLHGNFVDGQLSGGRIGYVRLFSVIAIFILLIACVNFMNLTIAQSVRRAREIGVRKVIGAVRSVLVKQFIGESLLFALLSVGVALILMTVLLPVFNYVTEKELKIPFGQTSFWLDLLGLTLLTGLISGSYPALYLSAAKPIAVLKNGRGEIRGSGRGATTLIGRMLSKIGSGMIRKGLVVFQFVLSAVLIVATIVVTQQVKFIQKLNLGYDRENLVYIPVEGQIGQKYGAFKNEALQLPGVANVSEISLSPANINNTTTSIFWPGKDTTQVTRFFIAQVSNDFATTMRLKLLAGREYSKAFPSDRAGYMINETAAKTMGFRDPLGQEIVFWGRKGPIIGVVKDFNFSSIHNAIQPMIIRASDGPPEEGAQILVRVRAGSTAETMAGLEKIYKELNPGFAFSWTFSDEEYLKLYTSELLTGRLSNVFACLAIFISCLGLLGLAAFAAAQRVKEIGIRKILGASVVSLWGLLASEFLSLVAIAILVAMPIAWYGVNSWLQDYAYHVAVHGWVFLLAAFLVLLTALLTVSFQVVKASLVNPVKSLRTE